MESSSRASSEGSSSDPNKWNRQLLPVFFFLFPLIASMGLYKTAMEFDAAGHPSDYPNHSITVPNHNRHILDVLEKIGDGVLPGPEDLAYDSQDNFLYTGCSDGWIKRIKLVFDGVEEAFKVENWTFVGGRPLGLAFGPHRRLYVANAYKGLMVIESDGRTLTMLTDEAEGVKFLLTDGVDVASDGMVYFTDASYKYNFKDHVLDVYEGRPHGRLLRYDPNTKHTQVLLRDLYFANGVALSPDQNSLVFCESPMKRCLKYHIHGDRRGAVDNFIKNLPGFVDNIRYDGNDRYWIAIALNVSPFIQTAWKYPFFRNMMAFAEKNGIRFPSSYSDGGLLEVGIHGEPLSFHTDHRLKHVTGGMKIGNHLYFGNLIETHIGRVELTR